jgi:hypothetical protein
LTRVFDAAARLPAAAAIFQPQILIQNIKQNQNRRDPGRFRHKRGRQ